MHYLLNWSVLLRENPFFDFESRGGSERNTLQSFSRFSPDRKDRSPKRNTHHWLFVFREGRLCINQSSTSSFYIYCYCFTFHDSSTTCLPSLSLPQELEDLSSYPLSTEARIVTNLCSSVILERGVLCEITRFIIIKFFVSSWIKPSVNWSCVKSLSSKTGDFA